MAQTAVTDVLAESFVIEGVRPLSGRITLTNVTGAITSAGRLSANAAVVQAVAGNALAVQATNVKVVIDPAQPDAGQWYDRGGGIYLGGGSLLVSGSTVAENAVTGSPATFGGKPNLGGGGLAATIGNANMVENVCLRQSIVVGTRKRK